MADKFLKKPNFLFWIYWGMSYQDTIFQDLFGTMRYSKKKEETKQSKYVDQPQNGSPPWDMQTSLWKRNFTRRDLTLNPRTPNSFLTRNFSHKSSLSWKTPWTPEVLSVRCPGVSCAFSLSASASLSSSGSFSGSCRRKFPWENQAKRPHHLLSVPHRPF